MPYATPLPDRDRPLLILDFDGTVCIGDGPVWAYADAVLRRVDGADKDAAIRARLAEFLDGCTDAPRYKDGYSAVAELTADIVDADDRQEAYRESRAALATGLSAGVSAPEGLHEFLTDVGELADRALVTNAPLDGVKETLSSLGLTDVIDSIHPESHKPEGLPALLSEFAGDRDPALLMSVGDVYDNDIAPAYAFGSATAYIDRWSHHTGPSHLHAATFTDLYPAIRSWAEHPLDFQSVAANSHAHTRNPPNHYQGNPS
ncbi:HAD family hydrolase [Spelaeicoccus albus]|uniref:FMN phosphatase YigB (HAD superfamily) n=1 Tax=Spelaeicoccus albus TaxID=1280376 RepID=A0A7Z0A9K2_9MICO|nr:HAD family hydrolase [Spelaeicoccus albus]NYI65870.1 FMN phosphatase YigB (HAD superfamily) [Spelaeicoccus albus]